MNLQHKNIVLGVTGSIAAYKSADLVRRLKDQGANVRVVMTQSALSFITPLTFQALSGNPVHSELMDEQSEAGMGHIELARWADCLLIAPATANLMAKLAVGQADDLLTTLCLATAAPIAVAPAMNQQMWANKKTQQQQQQLKQDGVYIFGPAAGDQACGDIGEGRMLEPDALVQLTSDLFQTGSLAGKSLVITAGPTHEAIDPVRYISNRSSGKMGYAIAQAGLEAGASVTLISGPVTLKPPKGVTLYSVKTAADMFDAVMLHAPKCDIFIGAAAIADYRAEQPAAQKIKKSDDHLTLKLCKNPDVIAELSQQLGEQPAKPFLVGFAAETEHLKTNALLKLNNKSLDMIAANLVGSNKQGFESDNNALELYWHGGSQSIPVQSKKKCARELVSVIAKLYQPQSVVTQLHTKNERT